MFDKDITKETEERVDNVESKDMWRAKVGEHALTTKKLQCGIDYIEKETEVVVVAVEEFHGYTIRAVGSDMTVDCGWDSIEKLPVQAMTPQIDVHDIMADITQFMKYDRECIERYRERAKALDRIIRELSNSESRCTMTISVRNCYSTQDKGASIDIALDAVDMHGLDKFRENGVELLSRLYESTHQWMRYIEEKYAKLKNAYDPEQ